MRKRDREKESVRVKGHKRVTRARESIDNSTTVALLKVRDSKEG